MFGSSTTSLSAYLPPVFWIVTYRSSSVLFSVFHAAFSLLLFRSPRAPKFFCCLCCPPPRCFFQFCVYSWLAFLMSSMCSFFLLRYLSQSWSAFPSSAVGVEIIPGWISPQGCFLSCIPPRWVACPWWVFSMMARTGCCWVSPH